MTFINPAAIGSIPSGAWTPIRYPQAIWDDQLRSARPPSKATIWRVVTEADPGALSILAPSHEGAS